MALAKTWQTAIDRCVEARLDARLDARNREVEMQMPQASLQGLIIEEVADELVVYRMGTDEVHRLNPSATRVWRRCDGNSQVRDVAADLEPELEPGEREAMVQLALAELSDAALLESALPAAVGTSRREALQSLARLAVLLPAVATILAPKAAAARSDV